MSDTPEQVVVDAINRQYLNPIGVQAMVNYGFAALREAGYDIVKLPEPNERGRWASTRSHNDPVLISTPLSHIVAFWRPGSHDWSWSDEYGDLINDPVTERILARVNSEGIDFADKFAPVLLGSDGRVWDGHHRICIALMYRIDSLMVELAGGVS